MRKIKLYKKYAYGGNEFNPYVQNQIQQTSSSSAQMNNAGQGAANTVGSAIPIVGAFKAVGEGVAKGIRGDNKYGVAKSNTAAGAAAIFNPLQQTTDGFSAIGKGDFKGAALNLLAPPIAAFQKNEEMRKAQMYAERNYAEQQYKTTQQDQYQQALDQGFNLKGIDQSEKYMKKGGLYKSFANGGVAPLSSTNVMFNGKSHEEGGIKQPMVNGKKLSGVEVEGGETMSTANGQKFIFSDELGFADQHKPLARAIGKIEKKMKSNPNDSIAKKTLANLKEREEELKLRQELTKESLGIPNDSHNLKNGGLYKAAYGLPPYEEGQVPRNPFSAGYGEVPLTDQIRPNVDTTSMRLGSVGDYSGMGSDQYSTAFNKPSGSGFNFGAITNGISKAAPYAGALSNLFLNNQARSYDTPSEALPDYVKYKPVDYTNQKLETDMQRRELNKSLTNNLTNSSVAAAVKQKNLASTIRQKNLINQNETNVNTEGINRNRLVNSQIQQTRNNIDVENRDRVYNKEQRYLTNKGQILNNFSDIMQQQNRDSRLEGLESRKIDLLSKLDSDRGVYGRNLEISAIQDKKDRGQRLTRAERELLDNRKNGGIIKKSSKLYSSLKK